jgi:hypothetical protein
MLRRTEKAYCATIFVALVLAFSLLFSPYPTTWLASAATPAGAIIDLYSDKSPFDGRGANVSSDAFEPQELAVFHANVTYNGGALSKMLVAFEADGPRNSFQNITVVGSANSSDDGIADFSFRIPWPGQNYSEKGIFGPWVAFATVNVAGKVIVDTMPFQVGWIVSVVQIDTLDSTLKPRSVFVRQEKIIFNLTVQNIAKTAKNATVIVDANDSSDYPIIHVEMPSTLYQPGKANVKATSQIPVVANEGAANVSAEPFTAPPDQGGRLYSPAAYGTFNVSAGGDIAITSLTPSSNLVLVGEVVTMNVTVLNVGNQTVMFDLSVYDNQTLIDTRRVSGLAPRAQVTIAFSWNTSGVSPGFYELSASAPLVGDLTPSDNTFVDGVVQVVSKMPTNLHDVGVTNVVPSPTVVDPRGIVVVDVTVKNEGLSNETFYVSAYFGRALIGRKLVQSLAPSEQRLVVFTWNTSGVFPLKYVISAVADKVDGETHLSDNTFVDGTVTILPYPPFLPTLDWLIVLILVVVGGLIGLILLFLVAALGGTRRRRRSRATYTVVAHPHI